MESEIKCSIVGHQAQIVAICINEKCQNQRGLCGLCILQETHSLDLDYNKSQVISLNQFNEKLIEKSKSYEQLICDYEGSIEKLRFKLKCITDSLQQMIIQEEQKRNELKDRQIKMASYIKNISQQQITNNILSDILAFYYTQSPIKDTRINNIFDDIEKLLEQYKQSRIKIIKKDNINNQQQNLYFDDNNIQRKDPKLCQQLANHIQDILIAQISPNGFMIASSDTANILLLWNTIELQAQQIYINNCHILSLCFSDDSKWLFAGDNQGYIKIFDLNVGLKPKILNKLQDSAILGIFQISKNYLLQDMNGHIYNCQYENYKFTLIQDHNSGHPYINHAQYFQSSRDFCMAKQIYAFTNLQTIYFYSFPNIREIYSLNVFRDLGQIAFQENSSMLITTFLDNSEIFIWNFMDSLQLKQKLVLSSMPLNVSFYSSMIVFQTMNSIEMIALENYQLQKIINIPEKSVKLYPQLKFCNTKQSKDQQVHLCIRQNILIFIKE